MPDEWYDGIVVTRHVAVCFLPLWENRSVKMNGDNVLDLLTEDLISLPEAARELPTNPHVSAIYRWCNRGIRGVRLESIKIGGKMFTSRQSLTRFIQRTS